MHYICIIANRNNPKNTPVYRYEGDVEADTYLEALSKIVKVEIGDSFDLAHQCGEMAVLAEHYGISPLITLEKDEEFLFVLELGDWDGIDP
jgi:hypothetical protein